MARAMRFLVALLLLVGLTWAGKGNGGGKPGGGGGGGGAPPPGTIYFHVAGVGVHSMDGSGGDVTSLPAVDGVAEASWLEHADSSGGSHRWFLRFEIGGAPLRKALELEERSSSAHVALAQLYVEQGDTEAAQVHAARALELAPFSAVAMVVQARVLEARGDYREALRLLERGEELSTEVAAVFSSHKARVLSALGFQEKALEVAQAAVRKRPDDGDVWAMLARCRFMEGRKEEAERLARQAIEVSARSDVGLLRANWLAGAHDIHGLVLWSLGRPDEALAAYQRAIDARPTYLNAHIQRSDLYFHLGRYDLAIDAADQALAVAPLCVSAFVTKAESLSRLSRHDEALEVCSEAVDVAPDSAHARATLALALARVGRLADARESFSQALRLDPGNAAAWHQLGVFVNNHLHDPERALGHFETAALLVDRINPANCVLWINKATVLRTLGRHQAAIEAAEEATRMNPLDATAANCAAWLLVTAPVASVRDPERAVKFARKATELAPDQAHVWNTLGVSLGLAGNYQESLKALQRSMDLSSGGSAFDWFFVAVAKQKLGQNDARDWYDRAVDWMDKNAPGDEELQRFRAEAQHALGVSSH